MANSSKKRPQRKTLSLATRNNKPSATRKTKRRPDSNSSSEWEALDTEENSDSLGTATSQEEETPVKNKAKSSMTPSPAASTKNNPIPDDGDEADDEMADDEMDRPMPTIAGGYSHTKSSKAKISKANKGNVPWNKGRRRSEEVKAKISAGVRARNREVLETKLNNLGITEEEYYLRKRRLKLDREILRRKRLQDNKIVDNLRKAREKRLREEEEKRLKQEESKRRKEERRKEKVKKITVKREINFAPHEFDTMGTYAKCPVGGPGGLICCSVCASSYSQYLNSTAKDMEDQSINDIALEMNEIFQAVKNAESKLKTAITNS